MQTIIAQVNLQLKISSNSYLNFFFNFFSSFLNIFTPWIHKHEIKWNLTSKTLIPRSLHFEISSRAFTRTRNKDHAKKKERDSLTYLVVSLTTQRLSSRACKSTFKMICTKGKSLKCQQSHSQMITFKFYSIQSQNFFHNQSLTKTSTQPLIHLYTTLPQHYYYPS